ncbi:ABC transporter permease [Paenibacillus sp. FSL K6-2859]|uniref:ABC transporter permease n=1 Tax=Paenibacillus sp. FSL K6-2859 TaxID=2921482 RepID=UPI0030F83A45
MRKSRMFFTMLDSSFRKRKSRMLIALFAIIVGTAVISGLLSVYYDISAKMGMEFRSYGANLILTPSPDSQQTLFQQDTVQEIADIFPQEDVIGYTPSLYGLANFYTRRLIVVGTWFDQISKITPYWEITGTFEADRNATGIALVGKSVSEKLGYKIGDVLPMKDDITGNEQKVTVKAIISSGGTEDNQIFISFGDAQKLFQQENLANTAYFSITGDKLESTASAINAKYPLMELSQIKQISQICLQQNGDRVQSK